MYIHPQTEQGYFYYRNGVAAEEASIKLGVLLTWKQERFFPATSGFI